LGRKSVITVTLVLIAALRIAAQSGPSTFEFVENKGQWDKKVKFKGELPSGDFYLQQNGFTVVQYNTDDLFRYLRQRHRADEHGAYEPKQTGKKPKIDIVKPSPDNPSKDWNIRAHAYRVQFLNGNEQSEMTPDKFISAGTNYFIGNDPSKWARNVRTFQAVTYRNVYPNIDVRYYSESGQLKYDLVVHPGGDVSKILMRYEGADKLTIKNRELIIKTSVGDLKELYPYSYQFDNVKGRTEVAASYELVDSKTVRFKVADYSKTSTLIIDPTLIFCSFTGSRAPQWGFTATPGPDGALYSGGIVFGSGFPTNTGSYQTAFQGGQKDIGIFKFSSNGRQREYATYLGGSGNEYPHSLICDPQGNLVVMGRSYSSNYPGTTELENNGGGGDIVVTKLNADGSNIIGSLRIGGSGQDGVNVDDQQEGASSATRSTLRFYGDDSRSEVQLDPAGNIYVAAQTKSARFPKTAGTFQPNSGGAQDGVVMKIDPTCNTLIWASFIGGTTDDGAFVIDVQPGTNDLYVAGATTSNNVPGNKTGSLYPAYRGGQADGFVARIANNGTALLKFTYMGTPAFDAIYGIKFDRNGIPYIMGTTEGVWPVQNATWSVANSKQFVSKLQPDLSGFIYSTVWGSGSARPNISPVAFLVDRCENVYVSGWGGWIVPNAQDAYGMAGTVGMPTTPDAIKATTDNRDMYFIVIRKDATALLYGTFFGQSGGEGEHVDGGTSRYDEQGAIYQAICANCYGNQQAPITVPFPTTPGVWGPVNGTNGSECNLAVVKLAFNFAGVGSGPRAFIDGISDTIGCVPFTVNFRDTVRNARRYIWNFGDGSPDLDTTSFNVNHTYNLVGTYTIRLIAIDSTSCNIRDTSYVNVHARDDQATVDFAIRKVGDCDALNYLFTNNSVPPPGKPFRDSTFIWDFGDGTQVITGPGDVTHPYSTPGPYTVRLTLVDTNYCNSPATLSRNFNVAANVIARIQVDTPGCAPYDAQFTSASSGGHDFFWTFSDGGTSTDMNPVHHYETPGVYTINLLVIDTNTCNKRDSTTFTLTVHPRPFAEFNTTPVPAQNNTPTVFHNLSTGGVSYKYVFGDGDSTIKNTMDTVMHQYNETGTFNACLTTTNQFGCTETVCHEVQSLITPLLDVPNAFTPGRFGQNSTVRVQGFGIARMTWRIYNRWGQVVYESNNRKGGWDGTFKSQPQPMDVYAYTLDVEFTDGTKIRKTGDITLIR
jgi:gliding motility-associated-like protein